MILSFQKVFNNRYLGLKGLTQLDLASYGNEMCEEDYMYPDYL